MTCGALFWWILVRAAVRRGSVRSLVLSEMQHLAQTTSFHRPLPTAAMPMEAQPFCAVLVKNDFGEADWVEMRTFSIKALE